MFLLHTWYDPGEMFPIMPCPPTSTHMHQTQQCSSPPEWLSRTQSPDSLGAAQEMPLEWLLYPISILACESEHRWMEHVDIVVAWFYWTNFWIFRVTQSHDQMPQYEAMGFPASAGITLLQPKKWQSRISFLAAGELSLHQPSKCLFFSLVMCSCR